MSQTGYLERQLSKEVLAAIRLARRLGHDAVAELLLQTLEVLADGNLFDEDLSAVYFDIAAGAAKVQAPDPR